MFGRLFLFLLLIAQSLFSNENIEEKSTTSSALKNISDSAGGPTTMVDSVSVISGQYCEFECDITVMGPVPITVERSKYNGEMRTGYSDWRCNHLNHVSLEETHEKGHHKHLIGKLSGTHGSELTFSTRKKDGKKHILNLDIKNYSVSVTNCGGGEICGRTNQKNSKIVVYDDEMRSELIDSDNTRTHYKFEEKYSRNIFVKEVLPNLNQRLKETTFLVTRNRNGKLLGWSTEECFPINGHLSRKVVHLSDGRSVHYTYEDVVETRSIKDEEGYDKKVHKTFTLLKHVARPDGPEIHFNHYTEKGIDPSLLRKKVLPDGRYVGLEYYLRKETNDVFNIRKVKISSSSDIRCKRIRKINAPLGTDNSPHTKYHFLYDKVHNNCDVKKGATTVWDALGHKTIYRHETKRLTSLEKYAADDSLYTQEVYQWGKESESLGDLLHYAFKSGAGQVLFEKNYTYDDRHNIVRSELKGNLRNEGSYDTRVKTSTYTNDDRNLPVTIHDGEKLIEITYYEGTDLVRSKIQTGKDGLRKRMYYNYDDSAVMTMEMVDDGSGVTRFELDGITERRIRHIIPSDIGLPLVVTDNYMDENGQEVCVRKEVNTYSPIGRLINQKIYDGSDNYLCQLEWEYDTMGNVTVERDAEGFATHRHYDANGNMIFEQKDTQVFYKLWHYDFMNRMIAAEEVHPDVRLTSRFTYDFCGNKTSEADYYGNTTTYVYDEFNREVERRLPPVVTTCNNLFFPCDRKEYDFYGYVSADIDTTGGRTVYSNNLNGQCTKITYPNGSTEACELDLYGRIIRKVDKMGSTHSYQYDSHGRVIHEDFEGIAVKKARYNTFHLLEETDPSGLKTTYEYDRSGKKIKETCGTQETRYEYDSFGRLARVINSTEIRESDYDLKMRVTEERAYDLNGRLLSKIGYKYDLANRKTHTFTYTDEGVNVDEKMFNSHGDVVLHRNAKGEETFTTFMYEYFNERGQRVGRHEMVDPIGQRLVTILDMLGRIDTIELYNAVGNICQKRVYRYDQLGNRLQSEEFVYNKDKLDKTIINQWHWDGMSQLLVVIEGVGTPEVKATRTSYNLAGLKTSLTKPDGSTVSYQYDRWSRITELKGNNVCYQYEYDVMSRPVVIKDILKGTVTTKKFDAEHRLIEEKLGNDITLNFGWDGKGRITNLVVPDNGSVKVNYQGALLDSIVRLDNSGSERYRTTYDRYDLSGKILEMTLPGNVKLTKTYDELLRPTSIITSNWSQELGVYNGAGSLLDYKINDAEGLYDRHFTYDDLYQIASESGEFDHHYQHDSLYNLVDKDGKTCRFNSLNQPLDYEQVYDRNGNLVKDNHRTYHYDALDRLIEVIQNNGESTKYTYDSENRRLFSNDKKFLFQGQDEIGMMENNTLKHFRVLGSGLGAEISASVALEIDGEVFAPIHDNNGNISALYSIDGELVSSYRYSAFGECRLLGSVDSPWRYSSKRFDSETDLYYFGRRYYNPVTHRWISADPIKFDGGSNLYAYVLNNPLTQFDCYGLYAGFDNLTQHQYYQKFVGAVKTVAPMFGQVVEFIGFNFIPIPLVRDVVEFSGHVLSGKPINEYKMSYSRNHSEVGCIPGTNDSSKKVNYLTNGIFTTRDEFLDRAKAYSKENGGESVHYTYNGTKGIVTDLIECAMQKVGIMTPPDNIMKDHIKQLIDERGGPGSDVKVLLLAHSQGGIIAGNLANNLSPEYTGKIHLRTVGSGTVVNDKRFGSVKNYVSSCDIVPMLDVFSYAKGRMSKDSNMIVMRPVSFTIEHSFGCESYLKAREEIMLDFKNNF